MMTEYEKIITHIFNDACDKSDNIHADLERDIEWILRNKVYPPIKGEITAGKIKYRGLSIFYKYGSNTPEGISQRGHLFYFKSRLYEK